MKKLLYIMGAGRSGTTILSLLLNNLAGVRALGELHQMPEYALGDKTCNCGKSLKECAEWSWLPQHVLRNFAEDDYRKQACLLESHRYVFHYFFDRDRALKYSPYKNSNQVLFESNEQEILVDSAKYIGRGLALNSIFKERVRFLYLVRDPRGVVNSFGKEVQTSRTWLSATFYYAVVNTAAWIVSKTLLRKKVIIIRYEDLLVSPAEALTRIAQYIGKGSKDIDKVLKEPLSTGHIVGGNRLVEQPQVTFNGKDDWRQKMPTWKRLAVWFLLMPWCLIYGYKL